ncbi:MAG: hypothetical protein HOW73_23930 [Polyangiaceae bacterium]|nr:hypothetical protein [Polyangiaceae bacterium]
MTASSAAPVGQGMAAPDNDPALVDAIKTVLRTCKEALDQKNKFLHAKCDAWDQLKARDRKGARRTLLNLMFDADPAVRRMATDLFDSRSDASAEELKRMLLALESDLGPSPTNAGLAKLLIDESLAPELADRVLALGRARTTPTDVRGVIAAWWEDFERGYEVTTSLAAESSPDALAAAAHGYAHHFKGHEAEACAFWGRHVAADDEKLRQIAVGHLSGAEAANHTGDTESDWYVRGYRGGPSDHGTEADWCPLEIDGLLSTIEKDLTSDVIFKTYLDALGSIATHLMSTDEQKKRSIAILKQAVEKAAPESRRRALKVLVWWIPAELSYANRFAKDAILGSDVTWLHENIKGYREEAKARAERWATLKKTLEEEKKTP